MTPLRLDDNDIIGMTFVQPNTPITTEPPFRIAQPSRTAAAETLLNSLRAALENIPGLPRSSFVILPEFSVPAESIPVVEDLLRSEVCPANSVVIAGVEWLTAQEYAVLLAASSGTEQFKTKIPSEGFFINCILIWIKTSDSLLRYIQPKLRPSTPEAATQVMYRGDDLLVFVTSEPNQFSFASLICFDCIALEGEVPMLNQLLRALPVTNANTAFNLNILFIPQHNNAPEHESFLDFATQFLNGGGTRLNTADSTVAFVNSGAGTRGRSDREFGRSSLFYRAGKWQSVPDDGPLNRVPNTYALESLNASLMRARFREDGPCIHRFGLVLPWRVTRQAGALRVPLVDARVKRFNPDGTLGAWQSVPALSQVFTDWLPDNLATSDARFRGQINLQEEYTLIKNCFHGIALSSPERVGQVVDLLLTAYSAPCCRPKINPDAWQKPVPEWRNEIHGLAIVELAIVCSVLQLIGAVHVEQSSAVKTADCGNMVFAVIDGNNQRSPEHLVRTYFEWIAKHALADIAGKNIVLILTRPSSVYLTTANNVAEEIKSHIGELSQRDEAELRAINPDLATSKTAITEDATRFFKHFGSILLHCIQQPTEVEAASFLRERLGDAI